MTALCDIIARAKSAPKHIVLAEGQDTRIIQGAVKAAQDKLAHVTLLGPVDAIRKLTREGGDSEDKITIIEPHSSPDLNAYAKAYSDIYPQKTPDLNSAKTAVSDPVNFANMMVRSGICDGSLAGAVHSTGNIIRSAQKIIGHDSDHKMISSFFIIIPPHIQRRGNSMMIFADCAWVVAPNKEQLARIAAATADSAKSLLNIDPKIAMLSFSTRGSARHPHVKKIETAGQILRQMRPDLAVESAVQFDAAINQAIAARKAPNSKVAGQANILIFPDLNSGNIGYKIAERIGGAKAIGPIFQGFTKPANDLSRGCSADDIYNMIAVTTVQAQVGNKQRDRL